MNPSLLGCCASGLPGMPMSLTGITFRCGKNWFHDSFAHGPVDHCESVFRTIQRSRSLLWRKDQGHAVYIHFPRLFPLILLTKQIHAVRDIIYFKSEPK